VTAPDEIQPAFRQAKAWLEEFRVPIVVEMILERVTNVSMGTEIDNVTEFEETLDLSPAFALTTE
jgi:tartronate-semialdehyde synthase